MASLDDGMAPLDGSQSGLRADQDAAADRSSEDYGVMLRGLASTDFAARDRIEFVEQLPVQSVPGIEGHLDR
jgi:hypothetical protein